VSQVQSTDECVGPGPEFKGGGGSVPLSSLEPRRLINHVKLESYANCLEHFKSSRLTALNGAHQEDSTTGLRCWRMLINHNNKIKTSACTHHIFLDTFATVADKAGIVKFLINI
jgi:hypothetical protein